MDRAEWLAKRRETLGASEVAAVCGLDPSKTALDVWAGKKGLLADEGSEAAELGNLLEPVILQRYADRLRVTLTRPGTMSGKEPWITATPDAISSARRNVQAKAVGRHMAHHWDDGAPEYVQAQTQWEMMVAALPATDVAALICSTEFQIFAIDSDAKIQSYLVEICGRFWRDHVLADRMPEVDGSETAASILRSLYRERGGMLEAVPEFIEMAMEHERLTAECKRLDNERETLRNLMRQAIGTNSGIQWPGGRVTWKTNKAGDRPLLVKVRKS